MGILRTGVLLAGGLLMLPSPPDSDESLRQAAEEQAVQASYLVAATSALSDLTSFCVRQPEACKTAGLLAARIERNTKYSIKLLYEWATAPEEPTPSARTAVLTADPMTTGSTDGEALPSQSTLKIDDLLPPWLGPKSGKG